MKTSDIFITDPFTYRKRDTVGVRVGKTVIGGKNDIVIQSMGTVDTNDIEGAVQQAIRITEAGGELVRFTAQGEREARAMGEIRRKLREAGCDVPLVADIHFNPKAAFTAARLVEKVRINPGNFVDGRAVFKHVDYTESEYAQELEKLKKTFSELLDICIENGTALRIGVNHGSLSDRIMSRYGDTPEGMVESAMEFLRICGKKGFSDVVVSMKSSNTTVMVAAYRMLVDAMDKEGMRYPLHLGVTEAGEGDEGRIRSAVGIGALLNDGIGDTIRVSLTEEPEAEIPVARELANYYKNRNIAPLEGKYINGDNSKTPFIVIDEKENAPADKNFGDMVYNGDDKDFIRVTTGNIDMIDISDTEKILVLDANYPQEHRYLHSILRSKGIENRTVIFKEYNENDIQSFQLKSAADMGGLLIDGIGDGIWLRNRGTASVYDTLMSILQASRRRISRAEYISCPGCGRTLFDIQAAVRKVKERTAGLKNIKIAVMGCIVNGPGEMADADYGYVGAGRGTVTLYKGKTAVIKNIPQETAVDELIKLIRENGDWNE